MKSSFRIFLVVALAVTFLPIGVLNAATDTGSSIGAASCGTIDSNWKKYGRQIWGANTKVSDVVLNACEAIGGERLCNFTSGCRYAPGTPKPPNCKRNGGVSKSQHIKRNAIDLQVPKGKEKEFITLAICGLRKVNNCQGGLGLYRDKNTRDNLSPPIHIDVRQGTNAWSTGYSRDDITPSNIPDAQARSLLRGFDADKCTGGLVGDYSEQGIYGPPAQYVPSNGFPGNFNQGNNYGGGYGSQSPQQLAQNLARPQQVGSGGGQTLSQSSTLFRENTTSSNKEETLDSANIRVGLEQTQASSTQIGGDAEAATCEGSGLFGTNLFRTCKKTEASNSAKRNDKNNDGTIQNPIRHIVGSIPRVASRDNYVYDDDASVVQRALRVSGASDIFYGIYNPTDEGSREYGTLPQNENLAEYGQFAASEARVVAREAPRVFENSVRIAGFGARIVAYYGLINGASPLVLGGAPRTLIRIGQENGVLRTYNPFY